MTDKIPRCQAEVYHRDCLRVSIEACIICDENMLITNNGDSTVTVEEGA